jgi:hypothetical protein
LKKNKLDFRVDENGCFIVTSHRLNKDGYCNMWHNHRARRAHRHIYQECFGEIEEGLVVRHKCDKPSCINPEHLVLGTPKDNVMDTFSRGRRAIGERSGTNKITEEKAREIKIMLKDGKRNCEIMSSLNVSAKIVSSIREYKTWKHVAI